VRLTTNGTRLHRAGWDWLAAVDEVYVSVYPGTAVRADALLELRDRARRTGTRIAVNHFTHFRAVLPMVASPLSRRRRSLKHAR